MWDVGAVAFLDARDPTSETSDDDFGGGDILDETPSPSLVHHRVDAKP